MKEREKDFIAQYGLSILGDKISEESFKCNDLASQFVGHFLKELSDEGKKSAKKKLWEDLRNRR